MDISARRDAARATFGCDCLEQRLKLDRVLMVARRELSALAEANAMDFIVVLADNAFNKVKIRVRSVRLDR
jgi:hypothetical protein